MKSYAILSKGVKRIVIEDDSGKVIKEVKNLIYFDQEVDKLPIVAIKDRAVESVK
jgi:hypothetical protein